MKFESLFFFPIPKLLIIKDIRIGILNRISQFLIFIFVLVNLFYYELYYNIEVPKGYITSMWSERGNLYDLQREYSNSKNNTELSKKFSYCDNSTYNYIYKLPYWDYRNISCINLPYSEMYEKSVSEFFFLTMFHENRIHLYDCNHPNYLHLNNLNLGKNEITNYINNTNFTSELIEEKINLNNIYTNTELNCQIKDRLDGNCLCQNYKNYFTNGIEEMLFGFDYKYITSFNNGGNRYDSNSEGVITEIYNLDETYNRTIGKNENIMLKLKEWLELANIKLDRENKATKLSEPSYLTDIKHCRFRTSGIEILLKIDCSNLKTFTKGDYGDTLCKIKPYINEGWASKGSMINYIQYPNLNDTYVESIYYDRYRYGIKFKFLFTGRIGNFNYNNFINTLLSGIVLLGTSASVILLIITNFCCSYTEKIKGVSISEFTNQNYKSIKCCFKKKKSDCNDENNKNSRNKEEQNDSVLRTDTEGINENKIKIKELAITYV